MAEDVINHTGTTGPDNARLATANEIARMSDLQSIARIDELREAATQCADRGDIQRARAFYSNACEIAQSNYVGTDVLAKYADFLEAHDLPGFAEVYRNEHHQLTEFLAQYDLPKPDYEERLRTVNAGAARGQDGGAYPHLRLIDTVDEARTAAGHLDGTTNTPHHTPTRHQ